MCRITESIPTRLSDFIQQLVICAYVVSINEQCPCRGFLAKLSTSLFCQIQTRTCSKPWLMNSVIEVNLCYCGVPLRDSGKAKQCTESLYAQEFFPFAILTGIEPVFFLMRFISSCLYFWHSVLSSYVSLSLCIMLYSLTSSPNRAITTIKSLPIALIENSEHWLRSHIHAIIPFLYFLTPMM